MLHLLIYNFNGDTQVDSILYQPEDSYMESTYYFSTIGILIYEKYFLRWVDSQFY